LRTPAPFRHVHVVAQALRLRADLATFLLPYRVMAVSAAGEGVRNLMQQRFPNCLLAVALDEVERQLDALEGVETESHLRLPPVERERPVVEAVCGQQLDRESVDGSGAG